MHVAALALLMACTEEVETSYVQFNGDDDTVEVQVGVDTVYVTDEDGNEVVEMASTVLTSSTGAVEIGVGWVDPSAGPVGSLHRILVQVSDEYAAEIDRASIRTDSGERGVDEYDLERDSAGEGWWVSELESVGDADEVRTDTITFVLYQEEAETEE
jgi:hypothetical protein